MRSSGRKLDEVRNIVIQPNYSPYAEGSCLIRCGNTRIICTASVDEHVPQFLKGTRKGWVTAEYGMIPRSTLTRMRRDSTNQKPSGRSLEIQRLIGRALRTVVDLALLGERQIIVDCDVIQADGGTRVTAITGGYVALVIAINSLLKRKVIKFNPIIGHIAAISCGIVNEKVMVDLEYTEDSEAQVDANFVMTDDGKIVEIQLSAEKHPFTVDQLHEMIALSTGAIKTLVGLQLDALSAVREKAV